MIAQQHRLQPRDLGPQFFRRNLAGCLGRGIRATVCRVVVAFVEVVAEGHGFGCSAGLLKSAICFLSAAFSLVNAVNCWLAICSHI